jgi:hypothetical protein
MCTRGFDLELNFYYSTLPSPNAFSDWLDDASSNNLLLCHLPISWRTRRPEAAPVETHCVQYFSSSWRCRDGCTAGGSSFDTRQGTISGIIWKEWWVSIALQHAANIVWSVFKCTAKMHCLTTWQLAWWYTLVPPQGTFPWLLLIAVIGFLFCSARSWDKHFCITLAGESKKVPASN